MANIPYLVYLLVFQLNVLFSLKLDCEATNSKQKGISVFLKRWSMGHVAHGELIKSTESRAPFQTT